MWKKCVPLAFKVLACCYISLFSCSYFPLNALDPHRAVTQYSVQVWDLEDGMPGNTVHAVLQTRDGYLWMGTQDGLVRFDGVDFDLFTREKIPGLKDNIIRALYQDKHGTLWAGSDSGGLISYKNGEFTVYPVSTHNALSRLRAIREDRRGNLWIASFTHGLTCLSNGGFTTYTVKDGLPHNQVRSIYKDGNNGLWASTIGGIVKILGPGKFEVYAGEDVLPGYKTVCLYDTETDALWIGTGEKGLQRLKDGKLTAFGTAQGLPHPTVTCLYKDRRSNLWIGTDGGGLTRMTNGVMSTLSARNGLADGYVSSIHEDREGSLWAGTLDGGIHRVKNGKFTIFTTTEGLSHDYIQCIYQSRSHGLLVGTKSGLNRLRNREAEPVPFKQLANQSVVSLFEDSGGVLWIGTWGKLYRLKDGVLTGMTKKDGLSGNGINCIMGDSRGNTWVGTQTGLNRIGSRDGKITVFTGKQGLSSPITRFIFEDRDKTLWVGTKTGLNRLNNGTFSTFQIGESTSRLFFRCAFQDSGGVLWFGTDSGLIRLKENRVTRYTIQSGLAGNYIYTILEDDTGNLWLGGSNGISRIGKKELEDFADKKIPRLHPVWYNESDGMKTRWCNDGGCKTGDGRLWFPTSMGAAVIDPGKTVDIAPPVIIKKFIVDDVRVNLYAAARQKTPLQLEPGIKRLEFYYTGVSFINPQKIRFTLKLDGYDSKWVEMGNARGTTYTGLSPGKYTFRVSAANPGEAVGKHSASISFYVRPYFYQTAPFYLLLVICILFLMFLFHRYRFRRFRIRQNELSALVELRTRDLTKQYAELEKTQQKVRHSKELIEAKNKQLEEQSNKLKEMDVVKSRFFANLSHQFRTPLTLIMGPLEQMIADCPEEAGERKKRLVLMLRNSHRLLRLINQLLDLSKLDSGKMKLQAAKTGIVSFVKGVSAAFELLARQHDLQLVFHPPVETAETAETGGPELFVYIDHRKMEDVLSNLLINAVKFTPGQGKIRVTVKAGEPGGHPAEFPEGFVSIAVFNSGAHIPDSQLPYIFDRFYRAGSDSDNQQEGTGIGLALVEELVELHRGTIGVSSLPGEGVEFTVRLPMGRAHLSAGEIVDAPPAPARTGVKLPMDMTAPAAAEEEAGDGPEPETGPTKKNIVLVVEDSADVREYIRSELEPVYAVEEAEDGKKGVEKALEIIPDLIISDIMMPGLDGYQLCGQLKNNVKTSHIPVILLTAKASEENILQGLETRADDYITKPFSTKILCARIRNLIDLRRHMQLTMQRDMALQPAEIPVSSIDQTFIKELHRVIEKNISDTLFSVEQLGKDLYMSRASLYRKIHALTGESPGEFIKSYRLKRGAQLLKANFGNVTEVAFEVGFSSRAYFTKCFKEKFHQLPRVYQDS